MYQIIGLLNNIEISVNNMMNKVLQVHLEKIYNNEPTTEYFLNWIGDIKTNMKNSVLHNHPKSNVDDIEFHIVPMSDDHYTTYELKDELYEVEIPTIDKSTISFTTEQTKELIIDFKDVNIPEHTLLVIGDNENHLTVTKGVVTIVVSDLVKESDKLSIPKLKCEIEVNNEDKE